MLTEKTIADALTDVLVPGVTRNLADMNLLQGIALTDNQAKITLASTALDENAQNWIREKCTGVIKGLNGGLQTEVIFVDKRPAEINRVKNVIAVMSGKGGVGKSLVSALTAMLLRSRGLNVGILDADITGPSIPRMFGLTSRPRGSESGILPVPSASGIQIISINLFLPEEEDAVIWRGPLIGKAITQFWEDVLWGNLDFMVVDLPPGTADAPLTALQVLPVNGIIVVFTPQDLTTMIVKKAVRMAGQMNKRVLGVVENMSYLYLPELKKNVEIFGRSRGEEMAKAAGAPLLARIPVDPRLAALCDEGHIERYSSDAMDSLREGLLKVIPSIASVP
ncbi:MAG: Mrp/NBP35 family ATP-binding protein [Dehalococcoidia bacterium]